MFRRFILAASLFLPAALHAQTQPEYAGRRVELVNRLTDGVILILGAHEPAQDFLSFEQAPAFMYLTGLREPDAALVMVKQNGVVRATMFVQPKQPSREVWTGTRIGVDGISNLTGMRGRQSADLMKVLDSLNAAGLPFHVVGDVERETEDAKVFAFRTPDEQIVDHLRKSRPAIKLDVVNEVVDQMRGHKSASEITMIRNAVDITVRAQKEAIPYIKPGMNEFEIQALIEYTFRRNGADRPSFSTIVGSGPNATTLHYNVDDRFISGSDMIVMDIGASFRGYSADVTRSVPASGVFSPEQRAIYQLVRDAQSAAERQAKIGNAARLMSDSSSAVLAAGLTKLGLIESPNATYDCGTAQAPRPCLQLQLYYMHGIGHGIGLEVHDPDQFYFTGRIQPGSAFTIEPGVYVREHLLDEIPATPRNRDFAARVGAAIARYKNIGVRIEDDYLVTAAGVECLSQGAPREINEIEALMKQGSTGPAARDVFRVEKYRMVP